MRKRLKKIAEKIIQLEKAKVQDQDQIEDLIKDLSIEDLLELDEYIYTILKTPSMFTKLFF